MYVSENELAFNGDQILDCGFVDDETVIDVSDITVEENNEEGSEHLNDLHEVFSESGEYINDSEENLLENDKEGLEHINNLDLNNLENETPISNCGENYDEFVLSENEIDLEAIIDFSETSFMRMFRVDDINNTSEQKEDGDGETVNLDEEYGEEFPIEDTFNQNYVEGTESEEVGEEVEDENSNEEVGTAVEGMFDYNHEHINEELDEEVGEEHLNKELEETINLFEDMTPYVYENFEAHDKENVEDSYGVEFVNVDSVEVYEEHDDEHERVPVENASEDFNIKDVSEEFVYIGDETLNDSSIEEIEQESVGEESESVNVDSESSMEDIAESLEDETYWIDSMSN